MTQQAPRPDAPKIVVVTGAGTGMGRDIALDQAAAGHHVVLVGRREEPLRETAKLGGSPDTFTVVAADTSTADGVAALVAAVGGRAVSGFVAVAGGNTGGMGETTESRDAAVTESLRKNLFSALLPIEALLPHMADGAGRIVLISSTAARAGVGGPYAIAKSALEGYGRDLANRNGSRGITANTVAPGFVGDTEFFSAAGFGDTSTMVDRAAAQTLVGRIGQPSDITAAVRWLLAEDAGWVTGQTIVISGGTLTGR